MVRFTTLHSMNPASKPFTFGHVIWAANVEQFGFRLKDPNQPTLAPLVARPAILAVWNGALPGIKCPSEFDGLIFPLTSEQAQLLHAAGLFPPKRPDR
jgi:hypothetical protein